MIQKLLTLILASLGISAVAQVGGTTTYEFLRLPPSARIAALGGSLMTIQDSDLSLAYHNPAALNPQMHQKVSLQQCAYFAGSNHGFLSYGHHINSIPLTVHGGIQYANYGRFQEALPDGTLVGEFRAAEFAIFAGAGYQLSERLTVGANVKSILSYLGGFNSSGWGMDLGAMYSDTSHNLNLSINLRNIGSQFTSYARNGELEPIPFDAQIGIAHRLKYLPMRFSFIIHNLHRWNILYDNPDDQAQTLLGGEEPQENKVGKFFDNAFRHLIFNMEFLIGKKGKEFLFLRMGYNHQRRGELTQRGIFGMSGFSGGFGIRIKNFQIDYGVASYHFAGAAHHFGIAIDIDEFRKG